ncbi:MAG TPA: gamma-glutamylcyclotransferase family protein [Mucilaginibacter sp.]|jgi:hypothetical protein
MLVFAFAGNMNVDELSKKVPSAKKIGLAKLPGYDFVFNRTDDDQSSKANIIQSTDPDALVWGVLIEIDNREKSNFYDLDPLVSGLKPELVSCIDMNDEIYQAEALIAQPHATNIHLLPYHWYHQKIISQAKDAGLPEEYVTKISLMNFKVDPDRKY